MEEVMCKKDPGEQQELLKAFILAQSSTPLSRNVYFYVVVNYCSFSDV